MFTLSLVFPAKGYFFVSWFMQLVITNLKLEDSTSIGEISCK